MKKLAFLLIPFFGLFFPSNSFALQHNYDSFYTGDIITPPFVQGTDGKYFYDFSSTSLSTTDPQTYFLGGMILYLPNSNDDINSAYLTPYHGQLAYHLPYSYYDFTFSNNVCSTSEHSAVSDWIQYKEHNPISNTNVNEVYIRTRAYPVTGGYLPDVCYRLNASQYDVSYDYTYDGVWSFRTYDNSVFSQNGSLVGSGSPGHYTGLALNQSQTDSINGVVYSGNFSFSRLFSNSDVLSVRGLELPLFSHDGYFLKRENITQGRQFEWHFGFHFPDGVTPNFGPDSYARIRLENIYSLNGGSVGDLTFPCELHSIGVGDSGTNSNMSWDFVCPVTLPYTYAGFQPVFQLGTSDTTLFTSNGEWTFASAYLVTDNDYTLGDSFNSDLNGDMWGINNGRPTGESDVSWFDSFINLFNFSIPSTPLGLLFGGFINQESCASIPIIAGMIHSNESQVCPWFSADTRAITTPVLTLFSGFLVFGFIIHWLGSSSGNFLEDSDSHGNGSIKVGKRGK